MATYNYTKKAEDCIVEDAPVHHSGRDPRMPLDHDPEKEDQKSDYRDKLTLDEVAENDAEMAKYAIKNSNRYFFNSPLKANAFIGKCVQMTLNHCGLMILEGMPAELVQEKMDLEHHEDHFQGLLMFLSGFADQSRSPDSQSSALAQKPDSIPKIHDGSLRTLARCGW